jgi:exodeoxyribonuclease VII small subunit
VVRDLEEGQVGLAEALSRYEEGVRLLKQCYSLLEQAERRIELLTGVNAAGEPITETFDERAATLEEKADHRSQRRSRPAPARTKAAPSTPRNEIDEFPGLF